MCNRVVDVVPIPLNKQCCVQNVLVEMSLFTVAMNMSVKHLWQLVAMDAVLKNIRCLG